MKIGARIIKTGIAVTITMFVCKLLNLEPAFFGAVSAVVNMQPSIFLTVKTARDQILVHVLGVGAAIGFGYVIGGSPISMGVVTILLIVVYIKMNLQSGISMGIVAAVFVLGSSQEQFLPHALNRTAVVFTGLTTAMLVNVFLWPPRYHRQLKQKLREGNEATVRYFCQAVQAYVELENEPPDANQPEKERVHRLNAEIRALSRLAERESNVLISGLSAQNKSAVLAGKLIAYDDILMEKADRVYAVVQARFERRLQQGNPPVSEEFKAILAILGNGCLAIERVNEKLRGVILDGGEAEAEAISEEYWDKLSKAIEQWQPNLTSSYYVHGLIDAAVTASEIKWAARQAKQLLQESADEALE